MYARYFMDPTTTSLIVSQSITLFLLLISEILPLTNLQYNGVLQIVIGLIKQTAIAMIRENPPPPLSPPTIVQVADVLTQTEEIPLR